MADKKPPEIRNQASLLSQAIVATPIGIGGYYTYKGIKQNWEDVSYPITQTTQIANKAVNEFASTFRTSATSQYVKPWQLEQLAKFASMASGMTAEQMRSTLSRVAEQVDPTGEVNVLLRNKLAAATTGQEVLQDLSNIVHSSDSIYLSRAIGNFLDELPILENRLAEGLSIQPGVISPFEMKSLSARKITDISTLGPKLSSSIAKMEQLLGTTIRVSEITRPEGKELGSFLRLSFAPSKKHKLPSFQLNIPREVAPGVVANGISMQSRYITGRYGLISEGKLHSFKYDEWVADRFLEDQLPEILRGKVLERREINRITSQFERSFIEQAEYIPTITTGEHQGLDEYIKFRSRSLRMHTIGDTGAPRVLSEIEQYNLLSQGGIKTTSGTFIPLYPGHSPTQIAHGVMSTVDIRRGLVPEAFPFTRRPGAAFRPEYTPLWPAEILNDPLYNQFKWASEQRGVLAPMGRTAFISESVATDFAGSGLTSEGQGLISNRLSTQRQVSELVSFEVASDRTLDIEKYLGQQTKGKYNIGKVAPKGTVLGWSPQGDLVQLPFDVELNEAITYTDKNKRSFLRITGMRDITDTSVGKVLGTTKGMMAEISQLETNKLLNRITGKYYPQHLENIDVILTMGDLKKNRSLHYNQMFTQLWEFTKQNIDNGKTNSLIAANFANDPTKIISQMRRIATKGDIFNEEKMMRQIGGLARMANLTPEQMGSTFAAVPEVYGSLDILGQLTQEQATAIKGSKVATGVMQLFYGTEFGPGSGNVATIEPRMFELLNAPHYGPIGTELQKDIIARMSINNPQRLFEQQELASAIQSISELKPSQGVSPTEYLTSLGEDTILHPQSRTMNIKGIGSVYIPGTSTLNTLAEFKTQSGYTVSSDLSEQYRNVVESAAAYERRDITKDVLMKDIDELKVGLTQARVATVMGKGGLLRGRLPGSMFFTAMQPTASQYVPEGITGITAPYASKMFGDLERLGLYDEKELAQMRKQFFQGKNIYGFIGRHPFIGPYSTQPSAFRLIEGDKPIALINEQIRKAMIFQGKLDTGFNTVDVVDYLKNRSSTVPVGGEVVDALRLSPAVGMAMDYDSDIFSAAFAGPQLQKKLANTMYSREYQAAYREYSLRSQLLKSKASMGQSIASLNKQAAGSAIALSITEGGRLGKLSAELQNYKAGILYGLGNMSSEERLQSLHLLEWMEQTPISGKHIPKGEELKVIQTLDQMQAALNKKSAAGIEEAIGTVMSSAKASAVAALTEGFSIITNKNEQDFVRGLDVSKAVQNVVSARQALDTMEEGGISAARLRNIMMRGAKPTQGEIKTLFSSQVLNQSPFGALFEATAVGDFKRFSQDSLSFINKLGQAGRRMIPLARPLALGTGAALGLSMLLSEPAQMIGSGENTPPAPNLRSGTGGSEIGSNMHPASRVVGEPTVNNKFSRKTMISPAERTGYRVSIQGTTGNNIDMRDLQNQLKGVHKGIRINSTIDDKRGSLSARKLSSILEEG